MNKSKAFKALASDSRWDILNALADEPKGITVRHHLNSLTQAGLVEPLPERKGASAVPPPFTGSRGKT